MRSITKLLTISVFSIALAFGFSACGGAAEKKTETKPADTKSADNKSADTKPAERAATDSIGVPECDDYIKKYEMCLNNKVPEAARANMKTSFDTIRKNWKDAAANPQGKEALASGCKIALESAKSSMKAYGCEW